MLKPFYSSFHNSVFVVDEAAKRTLLHYQVRDSAAARCPPYPPCWLVMTCACTCVRARVGWLAVRWLQTWVFYPLMAIARINLYLQSLLFIKKTTVPTVNKPLELAAMAVYFTWLGSLLWSLPTLTQALCYITIAHAIVGILHVQICLSHFTQPKYHGMAMTGVDHDSWFVMQVATSLDIATTWYDELFHGGLQYQVEHHLFPRVPRCNLRKIRPLVMEMCARHNIQYNIMGFVEANLALLNTLRESAVESYNLDIDKVRALAHGA